MRVIHLAVIVTGSACQHTAVGAGLQSLAKEKRRLQSGVAQLERELVAREGQLSGQAGELAALQEAQRDAHAQMNQYVMDLQVLTACIHSRQCGRHTLCSRTTHL